MVKDLGTFRGRCEEFYSEERTIHGRYDIHLQIFTDKLGHGAFIAIKRKTSLYKHKDRILNRQSLGQNYRFMDV